MIWLLQTVDVTTTVAVDATMVADAATTADAAMEPAFLEAAPQLYPLDHHPDVLLWQQRLRQWLWMR